MKNRNWFCYSLDMLGLAMLAGAGLALLSALWFAGATLETSLIGAFSVALKVAVGAFLAARTFEIGRILVNERYAEKPQTETYASDNIEQLPKRDNLPRAA